MLKLKSVWELKEKEECSADDCRGNADSSGSWFGESSLGQGDDVKPRGGGNWGGNCVSAAEEGVQGRTFSKEQNLQEYLQLLQ